MVKAILYQLRDRVNTHAGAFTIVLVIIIGMCLATLLSRGGNAVIEAPPDFDPGPQWFFDVETQEVFVDSGRHIPPFENAAGHECVRAVMYGCGGCGEKQRFVAYYEKYTSSGQAVVQQYGTYEDALMADENLNQQRLVSDNGVAWLAASSPEGARVMTAFLEHCTTARPLPCRPAPPTGLRPPTPAAR
ncbi:MAG: hypothetical protein GC159_23635 [Phycisphaera sp.]|nr:hypothetical protein [Phycisphaera sp.]